MNSCKKDGVESTDSCTGDFADSSVVHPKGIFYQELIDKYTRKGLPGIVLLIRDNKGLWIGASGMADIEKKTNMQSCTVSKVASITKLFMGTLVMKLVEEGTLDLNENVSKWLATDQIGKIENADKCTLRQLLNHTSGIYDVIADSQFYLDLLNNPNKNWQSDELLKYACDKPALFAPGAGVKYSNTNFVLVAMIIEQATGKPHGEVLRTKILDPLQLKHTYYYWHESLPGNVVQGYFDLYNNNSILNLSNYQTGSGNGFGGLYSTVNDIKIFIEALLKDKTLLKPSSLDTLLTFTAEEEGSYRKFGIGIFKDFLDRSADEYGLGHRGRDLAYSADLFYFPKNNTTMAFMVNYGTNGNSSLKPVFMEFRKEVGDVIFK